MTILKIAPIDSPAMRYGMLTKGQFLAAVKAAAGGNQAEIARVLGISEAAVSLMYKDPADKSTKGKPRKLDYEEAVRLADRYGIDPNALTVEKLIPVLQMLLANPPAQWTDHSIVRFAEDLIYGLELLQYSSSIAPDQGQLDVAARAIARRRLERRGEEDT